VLGVLREIIRERAEPGDHFVGMRSVGHGLGQFEEQRLVRYKDDTGAFQPFHGSVRAACGRKQQFPRGEDIEPEIEQAKARLQYADIGFTARDNDLLLQALEVGANGLLLREIEEALLEQLCGAAERCLDARRHCALSVDRALEREDRRNAHIGEKPREAPIFLLSRARLHGSSCAKK
jgi:hypothetical protein